MDWVPRWDFLVAIVCGILGGVSLQTRWQKSDLRNMVAAKGGRVIGIKANKSRFRLKNESYDVLYVNGENKTVLAHYKNLSFASLRLENEAIVEDGYAFRSGK